MVFFAPPPNSTQWEFDTFIQYLFQQPRLVLALGLKHRHNNKKNNGVNLKKLDFSKAQRMRRNHGSGSKTRTKFRHSLCRQLSQWSRSWSASSLSGTEKELEIFRLIMSSNRSRRRQFEFLFLRNLLLKRNKNVGGPKKVTSHIFQKIFTLIESKQGQKKLLIRLSKS